jgi:peptidyl-dipeptidase A
MKTKNEAPKNISRLETISSKNELLPYLDSLEKKYEKACVTMGIANWNSYSHEGAYDLDAAKKEFTNIFTDTAAKAIIDEWLNRAPSLADKLLARRLELWHRCFIGGSIYADSAIAASENALQQKITNFKFIFNGKPITRAEINNGLREERKPRLRYKLWQVPSQLSAAVVDDLRRLVKLRNAKAQRLGFPNYYSLSLHLHAIDEEWLLTTLDLLEQHTRSRFEEFISTAAKKYHIKNFGPADFDYVLRESASLPDKYFAPESVFTVIHKFQKGIGFNVDSLAIKEVVKDIPYGGLSLAITIPTDSRFLVNPTKGKGFYSVAFHEYGHSLKAVHTNVDYPILKGYEWIPGAQCAGFEEGVADMHGEFTDDSLWLATFTDVTVTQIERYMNGRSIPAMYRLRRLLKDFFIEYEIYKNPDQDLALLERTSFKKYLLVDLDENEPHQFASSIWYTSYPCYYQNYIIAGMIATQLQEALTAKFGDDKCINPHLAEFMIKNLYESGETLEWTERIRNATGKSLEPGAYLRKLGIEDSHPLTKD